MDETDLALCRSLLMNSRMSYSELGKNMGLTPQAVHRRVQALIDAENITGTGTFLTLKAQGRMWVVIFGWSRAPSMDEVATALKRENDVAVFFIASGNYVYIHGGVRDTNDMSSFVTKVQRLAQIHDAQVGILPSPPSTTKDALSRLDLRLVKSLQNDARRSISEVADEVGVSVKTAKKRLDRLIGEDLVQFSIHWSPDTQGDTITNIHLIIKEDVERDKVAFLLIKKLSAGVIRTYSFSNLPNQLIVMLWTRNVKEMQKDCRDLEEEGFFHSVVPNILRDIYYYDEHRHAILDMLLKNATPSERDRNGQ
ncbi:MAG TPA: AsnC family transcriptional regulator [Methanomassiliicoccales archaeon]|jgi:DNA-binding Lrp family transcriptional regulator